MSQQQHLIHRVYGLFLPRFRRRRFDKFVDALQPNRVDKILDVGGTPSSWTLLPPLQPLIEVLNLSAIDFDEKANPNHKIVASVGDATALVFRDKSFEIAYSNSVIEHVGDDLAQQRFASEIRRVGKDLWVQTPAHEFFFEPHFLAPFFHWLPESLRLRVGRLTPWAIISRADAATVEATVKEIRLLRYERMVELFPDCEIKREKVLGLTKSYIAIRRLTP